MLYTYCIHIIYILYTHHIQWYTLYIQQQIICIWWYSLQWNDCKKYHRYIISATVYVLCIQCITFTLYVILFCYLIAEILTCLLCCLFTEDMCHMLLIIYFADDVYRDIMLVNTTWSCVIFVVDWWWFEQLFTSAKKLIDGGLNNFLHPQRWCICANISSKLFSQND